MQIRRAVDADIREMHAVRLSVRENVLENAASVLTHHYQLLLNQDGRGWVAEVDGRVVGFAVADRVRSSVWALFVHPEFEGQGIGRRLHQTMIDWLFEMGAAHVHLSTDPNTRAERLYLAVGWQHAGFASNGEARYVLNKNPPA